MTRQFDVVANPFRFGHDERPFLVVVQHNRFSGLSTRILAPLVTKRVVAHESRLSPRVMVQGNSYFFDPTNVVTLQVRRLGRVIANVETDRDRIIAALDLVFTAV
jgi:toxin CcdB